MIDLTVHVLTWNEEFMLPYFLRHYKYAKKIVVHDNESTDNTVAIAGADPRVTVIPYASNNEQDNVTMCGLKNTCWKEDTTRWSIVCDADEFLVFDPGLLEQYDGQVAFKATGWDMMGTGEPLEEISRAFRHAVMDKILLFTPTIDSMNYTIGCHTAQPTCQIVRATEHRHHAMLSREYVLTRWKRYAPRMSTNDRKHGFGKHYRWSGRRILNLYDCWFKDSIPVPPLKHLWETGRLWIDQ